MGIVGNPPVGINVLFFEDGEVFRMSEDEPLLDFMDLYGYEPSDITETSGPLFQHVTDVRKLSVEALDWADGMLFTEEGEEARNIVNLATRFQQTSGATFEEFLSLMLEHDKWDEDNDLLSVEPDDHTELARWISDEYGINDQNDAVRAGIVDIDWDQVSDSYPGEMLEGSGGIVYVLDY